MKDLLPLRGIITVLNTPFTREDSLNLAGLRANVAESIDAGVAGFLVPAMASEVGQLSEGERDAMVAAVVEETAGRAYVIGGTSAPEAEVRARLARRCIALGCNGVLASIPHADDAAYAEAVRALDALGPGFLMLQDWDATGPGLPIPLIAALFETVPTFRALKIETVPPGPKYSAVLAATGGRLHVSGGWAVMHMMEALDRGVHAFMPTGMHRIYCEIYRRYAAGDRVGARALCGRIAPILAFSNQDLETSILFFKRLLHRQGIYPTANCRITGRALDVHQERIAEELIADAITLMDELGAPGARQ